MTSSQHPPAWDDADILAHAGEELGAVVEFIPSRSVLQDGVERMERAATKAERYAVLAELLGRAEDLPGWARGCEAEYARLGALPGGRDLVGQLRRAAKDAAKDARAALRGDELAEPTRKAPPSLREPAVWDALDLVHGGTEEAPTEAARKTLRNAVIVLAMDSRWAGRLRRNLFSGQDELDGVPVIDATETRVHLWLDEVYGLDLPTERVAEAVSYVAVQNGFHPVRDWLETLAWDGVERLPSLLWEVFHATDCEAAALNERLGVCWMVSAVARVMRPGCKVDTTLILVGDQGARKSTAIRILASGPWFADTILDLQNKDFYENIQGVWLYELQELDSLRHREWTRVKAVLSSQEDRWRRPYGRRTEAHQRQVCFVGTTNESQFLGDPTGARRFWPVRCRGVVDVEALERDRDQLWAEAVVRFKRGERWHLEGEEVAWAAAIADRFRHEDPWEEPVACWAGGQERFTLTECWRGALNREGREAPRAESMRLADVLRRVGYETKERRRVGYGAQVRLWGRVDGFGAGEPGVIYSGLATGQAPGEF